MRSARVLILMATLAGCGSDSPSMSPTPTPQTMTFTGTASISATGGCSNPGHAISAGDGTISITLTQANQPAVSVQVCHPTAQNHAAECTIPPFASLPVGQSVSATLRGGRAQTITIYPAGCGAPGTAAVTVNYTISATFPG